MCKYAYKTDTFSWSFVSWSFIYCETKNVIDMILRTEQFEMYNSKAQDKDGEHITDSVKIMVSDV